MKKFYFSIILFIILNSYVVCIQFFSKLRNLGLSWTASALVLVNTNIQPSFASPIDDPVAISRFQAIQTELLDLDQNWDAIAQRQGDNIRRKLGTVYTPPTCGSPFCGLPKFVQTFIQKHADDLDVAAFEEPMSIVLEAANQADYLAYSSIFSEYGNGGGGADYLEKAHLQIKRAVPAIAEVLEVIR
jgi:hypothetical protein